MRVYHSEYGEGIVLSTSGNVSNVKFDSGLTKDVSTASIQQVLYS